jgi:NTP pyrophosphatase (non-canonical NTP hydrolase)
LTTPTPGSPLPSAPPAGTPKVAYYCMACPEVFYDDTTSNAHHDATGHNQTWKADRGFAARNAPSAPLSGEERPPRIGRWRVSELRGGAWAVLAEGDDAEPLMSALRSVAPIPAASSDDAWICNCRLGSCVHGPEHAETCPLYRAPAAASSEGAGTTPRLMCEDSGYSCGQPATVQTLNVSMGCWQTWCRRHAPAPAVAPLPASREAAPTVTELAEAGAGATTLRALPITDRFACQYLSVRTASALGNSFPRRILGERPTIGAVVDASDEDLLRLANIGSVAVQEVHRLRAAVTGAGTFLSVDRCPRHGFAMLALMTLDDSGIGGGTRLLGSKSCCADRREVARWRVSADDLGRIAREIAPPTERTARLRGAQERERQDATTLERLAREIEHRRDLANERAEVHEGSADQWCHDQERDFWFEVDDLVELAREADMQATIRDCLEVCAARGWSLHWTARGAYLHLEASELIEAWRGKGTSTVAEEAGDVLLVLFSILGAAKVPWADAVGCARAKVEELRTKPRYPGEEFTASPAPSESAEGVPNA